MLTQEAALATAGYDFADMSAITQDQWGMVCPQFKPLLQANTTEIKEDCSPRLVDILEAMKTKCSTFDSVDHESETSEDQKAAMCQGINTLVS